MESFESTEKLDARWYNRFEALNFEDYDKLSGEKEHRAVEKQRFLARETLNPQLDYPKLETFNFDERENGLLELKQDILEREGNEAVKKIYRTKINESLAMLRMLRAAEVGDDRKFSRYADFIYGKPSAEDVAYVVSSIRERARRVIEDGQEGAKATAATELLAILPEVAEAGVTGVTRDVLPDGIEVPGHLSDADEAKRLFEIALGEFDADDWSVVVDTKTGLKNFRVSQEAKEVTVPESEQLKKRGLTLKKFKGLIEHEIKTHVARRVNGERSKLQLLGLGLDRYIEAEEGIATFNEQQVTGAQEFAGIPRFFSIALAKGLVANRETLGRPLR